MNKSEYRNFMGTTRAVMRSTMRRLSDLTREPFLTDEIIEESIGLCDTITVLSRKFYGRHDITLAERRKFTEMYRRES